MSRRPAQIGRAAWQRVQGRAPQHVESQIVWLFGSPRTGSTWLLKMLSEHPNIATINGPQIGEHLAPFMCDRPGVDLDQLTVENCTLYRYARETSPYFFSEHTREDWEPRLAELIRSWFHPRWLRDTRDRDGVIAVKEPNGSQAADLILRVLPRSRLLFLLRDGRDVVDSQVASQLPGSWVTRHYPYRGLGDEDRLQFVRICALKWLWRTEILERAYAAHPGPKLRLRYENLRADPIWGLAEVFGWLGLEVDRGVISEWVDRRTARSGPEEESGRVFEERGPRSFIREAPRGAWRHNLTTEEQTVLHDILSEKLRGLGYGEQGRGGVPERSGAGTSRGGGSDQP